VLQTPFVKVDDDWKFHCIEAMGTGMKGAVPACHMRYIVAKKSLVIELYGNGANGASFTGEAYLL